MEPWQKGAPAVKKMTKGAQASYFKRFPDREDWFRKNHPDMAHFDTSVKQASVQKVDKAKMAARAAMSLKAQGATRGTKTGGEGGNADAPPRDTIVPLSRDQHSAIQVAKKAAEPPKPEKPEKKPAAAKPLTQAQRIAAIARAAKKAQLPSEKEKRASQFDAPTFDPDDTDHDDYASAHYGMHQYKEEVEQVDETKIHVGYMNSKGEFIKTSTHNNSVDADKAFDELYKTKGKKARYNYDNGGSIDPGAMMSMHNRSPFGEEVDLEEGKIKSAAADRDDKGHEDFEATLSHAVKMAKGVAFDKRYKGGNMTGAVRAIRAIGKKFGMHELEDHPEVSSALRRANEELEINEMDSEGYTGSRDDGDPNKGTGKGTPISRKAMNKAAKNLFVSKIIQQRLGSNVLPSLKYGRRTLKQEEVEYIEERLSKSDPASTWISHFVGSENPMFSGKTKKERINMALGAYYKAKRAAPKNEEVEIDESKHEGRTPESEEETELAKHHGDPKKITYGDVVKARIASARRKKSED